MAQNGIRAAGPKPCLRRLRLILHNNGGIQCYVHLAFIPDLTGARTAGQACAHIYYFWHILGRFEPGKALNPANRRLTAVDLLKSSCLTGGSS